MSILNERIKERRLELGLTLLEVAEQLGVKEATMQRYESGQIKNIKHETIVALADIFKCTPAYLMGWDEQPRSMGVKINVYSRVPAGIPLEVIDDIVDTEEIPEEWTSGGREYFATIVCGDSMYPKYIEGDVIIVRKQPTCDSGQDCVVYVNGYEATLKKVIRLNDGGIRLQPFNTSYPPKTYYPNDEPISIAGVVVEIRRKP